MITKLFRTILQKKSNRIFRTLAAHVFIEVQCNSAALELNRINVELFQKKVLKSDKIKIYKQGPLISFFDRVTLVFFSMFLS